METWKILLITVLSAVVLGCILGVVIGKHQVKKQSGQYKPLLSVKERIIYSACILLGAGCILFGVFYTFPSAQNPNMPGGVIEGEIQPGGAVIGGEENPDFGAAVDGAPAGGEIATFDVQNEDDAADSDDGEDAEAEDAGTQTATPAPAGGGAVIVDGGTAVILR